MSADKQRAKLARDAFERDLRESMSTESGRRVMWWLLSSCGVFRLSFDNTGWTAFREGERNVGLRLQVELRTVCLDQYQAMEREATAAQKREDDLRAAQNSKGETDDD